MSGLHWKAWKASASISWWSPNFNHRNKGSPSVFIYNTNLDLSNMKLLFFFGLLSILLLRWLKLFLINLITIILSLKCSLTHSRRQQGKAKFTEQWTMNIFLIYFRPETEVPSSPSWALRGRLLLWPRQRENDDGWETQTGAGATPTAETTAE